MTVPNWKGCPYCGTVDGTDEGDHRDGCPTLDTCAQCEPHLPMPWHPDGDWHYDGKPQQYSMDLNRHIRDKHQDHRRQY